MKITEVDRPTRVSPTADVNGVSRWSLLKATLQSGKAIRVSCEEGVTLQILRRRISGHCRDARIISARLRTRATANRDGLICWLEPRT